MFDSNNPSYYRAHQYRNQFDLPNSAFKNRDLQTFPSSIPQGKEYFLQSNKKHFSHKFNRSEIEDDNVMHQYPEEQVKNSRIAFEPTYFRSLNVSDIEGTQPNTLISKAIKNRQKAEILMKKQQPQSWQIKPLFGTQNYNVQSGQYQYNIAKDSYSQDKPLTYKQKEAENKFQKSKSILQNSSFNILRNFGSKENNYQPQTNLKTLDETQMKKESSINSSGNFHYRGQSKVINSNLERYDTLKSEEDEITQFQKKSPNLKHERVYQIENTLLSNLQSKNKNIKSEREISHQNQNFHLPSRQFNLQYVNPSMINQNYKSTHQQNIIPRNQTIQQSSVKSQSRVNDYSYEPQKNYRINTEAQNSLQFVNMKTQIDKSNFRKFNPTYLSYQSQAVGRNNK